jgi:hypothetical protein
LLTFRRRESAGEVEKRRWESTFFKMIDGINVRGWVRSARREPLR